MRLVFIAIGWTFGILLTLADVWVLPMWGWLLLILVALTSVILSWDDPVFRWINIALLALVLGGFRVSMVPNTSSLSAFNDTGGLTIEGKVVGDPDIRDTNVLLTVESQQVFSGGFAYGVRGKVLVQLARDIEVHPGDRVTVTGRLSTPATYDTFSYRDYLAQQSVFSVLDEATLRDVTQSNGFWRWLSDSRRRLLADMGRMLPEPQAGLLAGILLGNEQGISTELAADFSRTGASHVIAISGFNMAIVAGIVDKLLRRRNTHNSGWQTLLALVIIGLYTLFTGANPAVVRAAIMSGVVIAGKSLKRDAYVPASLAFSVLVMTLQDPFVFHSVSFQLSFFAVLGIALFTDPLKQLVDQIVFARLSPFWAKRTTDFLSETVIVTLAASLATMPIIVVIFGQMSVVFLPVNILIVPVQAFILVIGGLATMLVLIVPILAQILYWLAYVYLSWTIVVVRLFADLPFADVSVSVNDRLIYLYLAGVIGWVVMQGFRPDWWEKFKRFVSDQKVVTASFASGIAVLVLVVMIGLDRPDGALHVWFLDVGHSNAVLIQTPGGAQLLVDGGRFPSRLLTAIGDRVPFHDRHLDVVVVSHPDSFDFSAVSAVLKRYDAGVVLTNGQPNLGKAYTVLMNEAARFPLVEGRAGHNIEFSDGTQLEILFPEQAPDLNDSLGYGPLVLRLEYGSVSFLLPSNLNQVSQRRSLDAGIWPESTVFQLPDHGGARSLDAGFLRAVQPSVVVIQTDAANRRGDPDPDVLAMLHEEVTILRTDEGGTIHLWTDGERLWSVQED